MITTELTAGEIADILTAIDYQTTNMAYWIEYPEETQQLEDIGNAIKTAADNGQNSITLAENEWLNVSYALSVYVDDMTKTGSEKNENFIDLFNTVQTAIAVDRIATALNRINTQREEN